MNDNRSAKFRVGVERAHFAPILTDPINLDPAATGAVTPTYGTPIHLPKIRFVNVTASNTPITVYADNAAQFTTISKGEKTAEVERFNISNEEQRLLFGYKQNADGITFDSKDSLPTQGAFGFARKLGDGTWELVWHLKGVFTKGAENATTQENTISPQFQGMTGTFVVRQCDGVTTVQINTDEASQSVIDNWFSLATLQKLYLEADPTSGIGGASANIPIVQMSAALTENVTKAQTDAANAATAADKAKEVAENAAAVAEAVEASALADAAAEAAKLNLAKLTGDTKPAADSKLAK
ncbi:MAG: hypothetical protein FWE27_08015 [Defluviitaleaceae bacterium]|nr:hypothetical protein [Defluviitaleaceae bacterium]